jgi:hypothetical protein
MLFADILMADATGRSQVSSMSALQRLGGAVQMPTNNSDDLEMMKYEVGQVYKTATNTLIIC